MQLLQYLMATFPGYQTPALPLSLTATDGAGCETLGTRPATCANTEQCQAYTECERNRN